MIKFIKNPYLKIYLTCEWDINFLNCILIIYIESYTFQFFWQRKHNTLTALQQNKMNHETLKQIPNYERYFYPSSNLIGFCCGTSTQKKKIKIHHNVILTQFTYSIKSIKNKNHSKWYKNKIYIYFLLQFSNSITFQTK